MDRPRYPAGSILAVSREEEALTGRVIGAAMEVHLMLGPGFLESIYQEALAHQFTLAGLEFRREHEVVVGFKGVVAGRQRLDFLVERRVIVELKAVAELTNTHKAQVRSYLRATGLRIGLLINFDPELLQVKRILNG